MTEIAQMQDELSVHTCEEECSSHQCANMTSTETVLVMKELPQNPIEILDGDLYSIHRHSDVESVVSKYRDEVVSECRSRSGWNGTVCQGCTNSLENADSGCACCGCEDAEIHILKLSDTQISADDIEKHSPRALRDRTYEKIVNSSKIVCDECNSRILGFSDAEHEETSNGSSKFNRIFWSSTATVVFVFLFSLVTGVSLSSSNYFLLSFLCMLLIERSMRYIQEHING